MPGHLANLSKHSLEEHVNLLRLIEELLTSTEHGLGLENVTVQLPVYEDWDCFVYIPNMKNIDFMTEIMRYGLIDDDTVKDAATAIGLNWEKYPIYGKLPLASKWKNVYRVSLRDLEDILPPKTKFPKES